jgi:hypothetical protein
MGTWALASVGSLQRVGDLQIYAFIEERSAWRTAGRARGLSDFGAVSKLLGSFFMSDYLPTNHGEFCEVPPQGSLQPVSVVPGTRTAPFDVLVLFFFFFWKET